MDEHERTQPPERAPESPEEREAREADQEHMQRLRRQRQARVAKAVVVLVIVILLIVFVTRNLDDVPIDFVFTTANFPLIWVLIFMTILGGVVGYLLGRPSKETRLHEKHDEKKHHEK